MGIRSYRELIVWQKSMELVTTIYKITEGFPKSELFGLTSQMRRSAISIPSNIAEGRSRGSRKEFRHFLLTAYASGAELETQIEIVKRLSLCKNLNFSEANKLLDEVMRILNKMGSSLKAIS